MERTRGLNKGEMVYKICKKDNYNIDGKFVYKVVRKMEVKCKSDFETFFLSKRKL